MEKLQHFPKSHQLTMSIETWGFPESGSSRTKNLLTNSLFWTSCCKPGVWGHSFMAEFPIIIQKLFTRFHVSESFEINFWLAAPVLPQDNGSHVLAFDGVIYFATRTIWVNSIQTPPFSIKSFEKHWKVSLWSYLFHRWWPQTCAECFWIMLRNQLSHIFTNNHAFKNGICCKNSFTFLSSLGNDDVIRFCSRHTIPKAMHLFSKAATWIRKHVWKQWKKISNSNNLLHRTFLNSTSAESVDLSMHTSWSGNLPSPECWVSACVCMKRCSEVGKRINCEGCHRHLFHFDALSKLLKKGRQVPKCWKQY